jgi:hypothetical protein
MNHLTSTYCLILNAAKGRVKLRAQDSGEVKWLLEVVPEQAKS